MSHVAAVGGEREVRFPRVSGDEPFPFCSSMAAFWFSPRERG